MFPGGPHSGPPSISLWVITFVLASGGNGVTFSQSVLGTVLEPEVFHSHSWSSSKDLSWSSKIMVPKMGACNAILMLQVSVSVLRFKLKIGVAKIEALFLI